MMKFELKGEALRRGLTWFSSWDAVDEPQAWQFELKGAALRREL